MRENYDSVTKRRLAANECLDIDIGVPNAVATCHELQAAWCRRIAFDFSTRRQASSGRKSFAFEMMRIYKDFRPKGLSATHMFKFAHAWPF